MTTPRAGACRPRPVRATAAWVCLAVGTLTLTACRVDEPAPGSSEGTRLAVRETYGEGGTRGVDLSATLVEEASPGVFGLNDVHISLRPGGREGVRKLEALLEDASLRAGAGDAPWPASVRSVPDQAAPPLSRLQLGLALLDLEGPGFDRPVVRLFEGAPTIGLTRVDRSQHGLRVRVLSLAVADGDAVVAWSSASGRREDDRIDLRGHRRILGQEPEAVQMTVRRAPSTPRPEPTGPTDG
ncbi:MAG: hypothetical protein ACQEXJ_11265 [Myxococcota bacterium]